MNGPGFGAPNPNAAGVAPFCPCPAPPKLNGDPGTTPVDVEGVTGVNTNEGGLESVDPFMVIGVAVLLETLKEDVGLFGAGAGVGCVVGNALTGVDVIPKAPPFVDGPGPGLEVSCLKALNGDMPGGVPVVAGLLGFEDGKVTLESDPPAGLLAAKLKSG